MKIIVFSPLKIFSIYYGVQPTDTAESAIFKLLAVWYLIHRWMAQFDKPFTRQIISKADSQLQKEIYLQLFIGEIVIFWFAEGLLLLLFFAFFFFFNWSSLSYFKLRLCWSIMKRHTLGYMIKPFWPWQANSNDQSWVHSIKTKLVLMR